MVMSVKLTVKIGKFNAVKVMKNFEKLEKRFKEEVGKKGLLYMKKNAPVKTGLMRDTIASIEEGDNTTIFPTTYYAKWVNEGTRHIRARRFIEQTAVELRADIPEMAERIFKQWEPSWKWGSATGTSKGISFEPGSFGETFR